MKLEQELAAELDRRTHLLQEELADWQRRAKSPTSGMGIHRSQIQAIAILCEAFKDNQQQALDRVVAAVGTPEFPARVTDLETELTTTHGVMAVFRMILGQRADPRFFRAALDTADLVAAACYLRCVDRAVEWKLVSKDQLRAPPLTYLNTMVSPAAIDRKGKFGAFRMPVDGSVDLKLPVGVVSLPFHHTEAIWTFCSLYHETGHLLDTDFRLGEELRGHLDARLSGSPRKAYWKERHRELVADAFGVLLGGEGYARQLTKLLYQPAAAVTTVDPSDEHPNHYVRMCLLQAMLRRLGDAELAAELQETWRGVYGPPGALQPYVGEVDAVAEVLLDQRLGALKGQQLRAFVTDDERASDRKLTAELATYLRRAKWPPDPTTFPIRLVPAAAQRAVDQVGSDHRARYGEIQLRTLEYVGQLRQHLPTFLAPGDLSEKRQEYLKAQAKKLDLAAMQAS